MPIARDSELSVLSVVNKFRSEKNLASLALLAVKTAEEPQKHLAAQKLRQSAQQKLGLDGFREIGSAAGVDALLFFVRAHASGQSNDRHILRSFMQAQGARDIQTRRVGQTEIEKYEVWRFATCNFDGLMSGAGFMDAITRIFQQQLESVAQEGVVFDQENRSGRGSHHKLILQVCGLPGNRDFVQPFFQQLPPQ